MIARFTHLPETFAELYAGIGAVPMERIRMRPPPGLATEEDVLEALAGADKRLFELVDGVLVEKPMGSAEAWIGLALGAALWTHVKGSDLGVVLGGDGAVRLRPGNIRYPDVSFIPWDAFPNGEPPDDEKIWSVTPTLAAEVLSESNTPSEIDRKLSDLFSTGCRLVWVIDPETRAAKVYTSARRFKQVDETGALDGGKVLPGFALPLADLFASTRRRKKKPR